jgi:uncharacterized OB-fold protein
MSEGRIWIKVGELNTLLRSLREAKELCDRGWDIIHFCVDCGRVFNPSKELALHEGHTTTFTDVDHDGIGEWITALEWIKRKGVEET